MLNLMADGWANLWPLDGEMLIKWELCVLIKKKSNLVAVPSLSFVCLPHPLLNMSVEYGQIIIIIIMWYSYRAKWRLVYEPRRQVIRSSNDRTTLFDRDKILPVQNSNRNSNISHVHEGWLHFNHQFGSVSTRSVRRIVISSTEQAEIPLIIIPNSHWTILLLLFHHSAHFDSSFCILIANIHSRSIIDQNRYQNSLNMGFKRPQRPSTPSFTICHVVFPFTWAKKTIPSSRVCVYKGVNETAINSNRVGLLLFLSVSPGGKESALLVVRTEQKIFTFEVKHRRFRDFLSTTTTIIIIDDPCSMLCSAVSQAPTTLYRSSHCHATTYSAFCLTSSAAAAAALVVGNSVVQFSSPPCVRRETQKLSKPTRTFVVLGVLRARGSANSHTRRISN